MTIASQNIVSLSVPAAEPEPLEVRWSCNVTRWTDRFGLFTNGQRHGVVEFVVSLTRDVKHDGLFSAAAWLAMGDRRKVVLPSAAASCTCMDDGELVHVDATLTGSGRRVLSVTRRGDALVFAQSPLLIEAGFTGGSYDPPALASIASHHTAASA